MGYHILTSHGVELVLQAFLNAATVRDAPEIIHSDQGSEYRSSAYTNTVSSLGAQISMSSKSSPWQNGYQESFYSQFKLDLGDPNRFESLGELVGAVQYQIYHYNHRRIHSALKIPPSVFIQRHLQRSNLLHKTV